MNPLIAVIEFFDVVHKMLIGDLYVHFTPVVNVPLIEEAGYLGNPPQNVTSGCTTQVGGLYVYNVAIARRFQFFGTLPAAVLAHPENFRAIVFTATPNTFTHFVEESVTRPLNFDTWEYPTVSLTDYIVVSTEEGLALLNTSIDAVRLQK